MRRAALARLIDHTLLRPEATEAEVRALCAEARAHGVASACVSPVWVPLAAEALAGSETRVCTVVGFPHGAQRTPVKAFEAGLAVRDGADELDVVLAVGRLKSGRLDEVEADLRAVVDAAEGRAVKVILETALLTDDEKRTACALARAAGAAFVKTSTGFAAHGATARDVALLRRAVGHAMGVKASGGIRTAADALEMVEAGASRLGTSASVAILEGLPLDVAP